MRLPVKPSDANAHSEQSGFLASERVKGPFPLDCIGDLCYRSREISFGWGLLTHADLHFFTRSHDCEEL